MRFVIIIALLLLAGCSHVPSKVSTPKPPVSQDALQTRWENHQKQLSSFPAWQAQGRLALARGSKGGNASFLWEQRGDYYQIKLWGPFGAGAVYLIGGPRQVEAKQSNGKVTRAPTPEALLQKIAGWQLPVSGLKHWLVGLPAPSTKVSNQQLTPEGYLSRLSQLGWRIDYDNYQSEKNIALPHKLLLKNGDVSVKMVITEWKAQ